MINNIDKTLARLTKKKEREPKYKKSEIKEEMVAKRTSLVAKQLRLCLPTQGVCVQSLVRKLRYTCLVVKKYPKHKTEEIL